MRNELHDLLLALDGVAQDPRWHPEGDALYHSLQAFDLARRATPDRTLQAAALFHDVGKALGSEDHAEVGADLLEGLVAPRVVWLVRHHLDLLHHPGATRRRLRGTPDLADLQRLRRWDVGGRSPHASVPSVDAALAILFDNDGGQAPQTPQESTAPGKLRGLRSPGAVDGAADLLAPTLDTADHRAPAAGASHETQEEA